MACVTRMVLLSGAASPNTRLQRTRPAVRSQGVRKRPVCGPAAGTFTLGAVLYPVLDLGHSRHQLHSSREGDGRRNVHVLV